MQNSIQNLVHRLIVWVRYLRRITAVKYSFFGLLLVLMIVGVKVATMPLTLPESLQLNDKVIHFVVFFCFAMLIDLVSSREPFWLWKAAPLIVYGVGIEVLQYFSPDRSFSLLDALADVSGVLVYWLIKLVLRYFDKKKSL